MDCNTFNARLSDWLDEGLDPEVAQEMRAHGGQCRMCGSAANSERKLRVALRSMPVPGLRPGFAREAIRLARQANGAIEGGSTRKRDALFAFGGAAAASLGVAAVLMLRGPIQAPGAGMPVSLPIQTIQAISVDPAAFQTVAMTIGHVESVRLRIESPRDFEEVRFSVELPDHVWLADQPGIRAMTWAGGLRKGENVLELPLIAQSSSTGLMTARVSWGLFEQRLQAQLIGSAGVAELIDDVAQEGGT
ncbi:MAG: anti-sigma factor family protein [Panacagrimonas sp.]